MMAQCDPSLLAALEESVGDAVRPSSWTAALEPAPAAFWGRLGVPPEAVEARDPRLLERARERFVGRSAPWVGVAVQGLAAIEGVILRTLPGGLLESPALARALASCEGVAVAALGASAGSDLDEEVEGLWKAGHLDDSMALHAYAVAAVERVRARVVATLKERIAAVGLHLHPHYSPGYRGFALAEGPRVLRLLREPGPLVIGAEGGIRPLRSTLAVLGIARRPLEGGWARVLEASAARGAQGRADAVGDAPGAARLAAESPPPFSERTLEKWSRERLRLEPAAGDCLVASFLLSGKTCMSLGRSFDLVYRVVLAPADAGQHRVEALSVEPAPGERGHEAMCAYQENPRAFLESLRPPRALLGLPLDAALAWSPVTSPAACLCVESSRNHKWRVVLHTLHHALARRSPGRHDETPEETRQETTHHANDPS